MLRPERIRLGAADGARASGTVVERQYFGAFWRLRIDVGPARLQVDLTDPASAVPETGEAAHLHWDARAVHALAEGPARGAPDARSPTGGARPVAEAR
jgi:putative spermidine/putrescine transport system ATP-binding protein